MDVLPCSCISPATRLANYSPSSALHTAYNALEWDGRKHVQHIFVQADQTRVAEDQIEVFKRFSQPEALHAVYLGWIDLRHILDGGVCNIGSGCAFDALVHFPGNVLIGPIASDAVENKDGFDSLWPAASVNNVPSSQPGLSTYLRMYLLSPMSANPGGSLLAPAKSISSCSVGTSDFISK